MLKKLFYKEGDGQGRLEYCRTIEGTHYREMCVEGDQNFEGKENPAIKEINNSERIE